MRKSNVLISGATGWLGREILNIFSETKFEAVKLSLISSKSQDFIAGDNKFEATSFVNYNNSDSIDNYFDFAFLSRSELKKIGPHKFKEINLEIISNSADLIKRYRPKTVVLSSSGAIYKNSKNSEYKMLYSDLKKIQEDLIISACNLVDSNLIISRIFNLSGRGIPNKGNFAISDLISKGIRNMDLTINSNHLVTRRYSDITQLLKLLVEMADRGQNRVFDSGGLKIELRDLANIIVEVIKCDSKVVAPTLDPSGMQDDYFSNSYEYEKLLSETLGEKSISIENQIENTKNSLMDVNYMHDFKHP
jgi:nucleoside-diphosphate-sugar epimerase